jgi:importin subunit beta-1
VVAQVLQQASGVQANPEGSYEMFDYVVSLREGIMDAWGGIIGALKTSSKRELGYQQAHDRWLILCRITSGAICRIDLQSSQHHR